MGNGFDAESARHISEAFKSNSTLQELTYAAAPPSVALYCQQPLTPRACFLADVLAFVCACLAA